MPYPLLPRACFAASNSCLGFKNYYGEIFTDTRMDRLYIIKGGPGTGKSHFMRIVARTARTAGYAVTECYCSSDPASLDGLLLTRDGFPTLGFLDGTAPHTREPVIPGASDELINLGAFWNAKALAREKDTIRTLGQAKSAAYARAYAYLRAAGEADAVADSLTEPCVQSDRLKALAERILRGVPSGETFAPLPTLRRALGMTGWATLPAFEEAAEGGTLLIPEDHYGTGYRLTRLLYTLSETRRHRLWVSFDPVFPHKIDGLFYPDTGLCVLVGDVTPPEQGITRAIHLRRYACAESLRPLRSDLRRAARLRDDLLSAALHSLSEAATFHFEMERIYAAAMDFGAKEKFTQAFCADLFGAEDNPLVNI